jgi:phosphatidylserine decarboxylase
MNRITIDCLKGRIVMQQVTGIIARRVVCNLSAGQEVIAGQRIGIMKFGSRMDLILPANVEIKVKSGDKVTAGISVIGEWK